jgi:hypothetical protein
MAKLRFRKSAEMPLTKGNNVRAFLKVLAKLHGEEATDKVVAALQPDLKDLVTSGQILASSWYPLDWLKHMYAVARRVIGPRPDFARHLGRTIVLQDLTGVYRIFLLVISPEYLFSKAPLVFNSYYDTGKLEVLETRKGFAQARFSGCRGFDRNIWQGLIGGCEGALIAAGGKDPVYEVLRGGGTTGEAGEDADAQVDFRWR